MKPAVPTISIKALADELGLGPLDIQLMLDQAGVPNASKIQHLTDEQADVIRKSNQAYVEGTPNPYDALPPVDEPEHEQGGAIAVQSNSQIEKVSREAQQLASGVVTILQELGVQQKLVEGHQQGLVEVAAYQAGRSAVWEGFAQQEIEAAQRAMGDRQAFDLQQALKDLGVTAPGDRLPKLGETTTSALNNLRKSAQQCTSSPWKK